MRGCGRIHCLYWDICESHDAPCDYCMPDDEEEIDAGYDEYREAWEQYTKEDTDSRTYLSRRDIDRITGGDF